MPTPSAFGAPRALRDRAARLWARHESLGCLLFAVAATLAVALVERASGATRHEPPRGGGGNYAVEWLLLGLVLGVGAALVANAAATTAAATAATAAMRVGLDPVRASRAKAA